MERRGNKVWIYTDGDELIGFAGIGRYKVPWPDIDSPPVPHQHVIYAGVDFRFRKKPEGPRNQHYSWRIFDDLVAYAQSVEGMAPVMSLFVDVRNLKAIEFYREYGFEDLPRTTEENGVTYQMMAVGI